MGIVLEDFFLECFVGLLDLGDLVLASYDFRGFSPWVYVQGDFALGAFVLRDSVPNPKKIQISQVTPFTKAH